MDYLVHRLVCSWHMVQQTPMRVNLRRRSDDRAGRARLSETAGSSATHHPIWPNAFASGNGSRPNRAQLHPRSCGLRETRPTCSVAQTLPKIMRSFSLGFHLMLTRMGSCRILGYFRQVPAGLIFSNHQRTCTIQIASPYVDAYGRLPDRFRYAPSSRQSGSDRLAGGAF
jgi:hypothetical protein